MDPNVRTAVIAAGAAVLTAVITSATTIWTSSKELRAKIEELNVINKQTQSNLTQATNILRYVYDNGTFSHSSVTGGRMVVRLNGSASAGPTTIPIDMARFEELCGDEDGCTMTLGATRFRFGEGSAVQISDAPLLGAPCRFFWMRSTKAWSLSQSCVAIYGLYAYNKAKAAYEFSQAYQPYNYSNTYGRDDSFSGKGDPDGGPLIIMSFKGACYLSESAPDTIRGGGNFMPDDALQPATGRGLFLTASSPRWDYPGSYPAAWPADDPQRACVLFVED